MNCPHCQRLLYSRQHKTCGFCHGELPPEARLSGEEIAALKAEQRAIAVRRETAREQEEIEREREREQRSGDGFVTFSSLD